jgi:Fe-S-cluster containining protein
MLLKHQLPKLYSDFFPKQLLELEPIESKATCQSCAMTKDKYRGKYPYRGDLKCCTFQPWIPNYALGEMFAQKELKVLAGRETVNHKIENFEYALPVGVVPSLKYQIQFNHRKPEDFGQRDDLLCSYYDKKTQLCKIWQYRGSVCTAYHCKSVHGSKGKTFWNSLESYLSYTEMALAEEALVHLDFSPRQVSELVGYMNRFEAKPSELKSDFMQAAHWKKVWNGYDNDPIGFYLKCFSIIKKLNRSDFEEVLGETGEQLEVELLLQCRIWENQ